MSRSLAVTCGYPRDMVGRRFLGRVAKACTVTAAMASAIAWPVGPPGVAHVGGTSAQAAESGTIGVVIDSLSPSIVTPDSTLRISGRLVNRSMDPAFDITVRLRISGAPIPDRATLAGISAQQTSLASVVDGPLIGAATQRLPERLTPGSQTAFALQAPVSALSLTRGGAYAVAVEVLAGGSAQEVPMLAGVQRTFMTWFPPGSAPKARVVWLWPLADWPARTADGLFLNDQTPNAVSPGGRLDRLVRVGARYPGVPTWVADPEVLQAATRMSAGYQVLQDGASRVGDQGPEAGAWLAAVDRAVTRNGMGQRAGGLLLAPYADIDARAARRVGLGADVIEAITMGPRIAAQAVDVPTVGTIAWSPRGRFDRATATLLDSAGVSDIIVGGLDQNDVPRAAVQRYASNLPGLRVVYLDPVLSAALGTREDTSEEVTLSRQRFLAETAVIAQRPVEGERTVVIGPPDMRWDPQPRMLNALLRATRQAPWISVTALPDVPTQPAGANVQPRQGGTSAAGSELSRDYLGRIRVMEGQLDRFVRILSSPETTWQAGSQSLIRAQSAAWRTEPWTGVELLQSIGSELDDQRSKVTVLSEGSITFSGSTGRIPVTLANDLDQAVTVGVRLVGEPGLRLIARDIEALEIEPKRKVSIDVNVQVVGSEPLPVRVQLLTPDGKVLQSSDTVMVMSTAYARAAGWVVIAAFVAIGVFVILGIARRILAARRQGGGPRTRGPVGGSEHE